MTEAPLTRRGAQRRRLILDAAALAAVGAGFAAGPARAKLAPADIGYQAAPRGAQRCDLCVNWRAPAACAVVAGPISPSGWCGLFAPKR